MTYAMLIKIGRHLHLTEPQIEELLRSLKKTKKEKGQKRRTLGRLKSTEKSDGC
jgi:hypothetical protein